MEEVIFDETSHSSLGDVAKELARSVVGMTLDKAMDYISAGGCEHRLAEKDGENFGLSMDYRFDRINLVVAEDMITNAKIG